MSITFVKGFTHSGAETLTNQLNGTAVQKAGATGLVRASFVSTLFTTNATLRGKKSGKSIIPPGSAAGPKALTDQGDAMGQQFIYEGFVEPDEELDLTVVAAAAATTLVAVRID